MALPYQIVSPLVSLMVDQVEDLRRRNVKTSLITSCSDLAKPLIAGETNLYTDSLLFCVPEALALPKWRAALETPAIFGRIVAVVVDEAHRVSKW